MENLYKQMRVKFSGVGQEKKEETSSTRDQRIPPQKTQSFKGEKKKRQNWFHRQFSWRMNQDYEDGGEYPTAVAAAAFAIKSLEESNILAQKKMNEGPDTSLTKIKTKAEDRTTPASEPRTVSRKFSVPEKKPEKAIDPAPSIKRTPTSADKKLNSTATKELEKTVPKKDIGSSSSVKKTPTFADENLKRTSTTKPESASRKPDLPPTKQSSFPPAEINRQRLTEPGIGDAKADAWEKAEMAKIKERYDKLSTSIHDWESKKKTKARRKLEKKEAESDRKRAKALQHYRSEVEMIEQIAVGARAQAEKNRRNEEFKVKEKANKIRSTGELPATCLCF